MKKTITFENNASYSQEVEIYANNTAHGKYMYRPLPNKYKGKIIEPIRSTNKISRNSLCECGSGIKSKKCCN